MATVIKHRAIIGVLLTCLLCPGETPGQNPGNPATARVPSEYEVKAAFLLNFVKFVEWPKSNAQSTLSICILGDDPFGSTLDDVTAGEKVDNRTVVIRHLKKLREDCQVLFVPGGEKDIRGILSQVGPGVLTVGESPDFLASGGIINFIIQNRRVRFDVNRMAAERGAVRLSSRLLGVAREVME